MSMNTIKFSKITEKTTEQHNIEVIDIQRVKIYGKEYDMYFPCNLNIFITNKCQNSCNFCINKGYTNTDITDELYYKSLEGVCNELKGKKIEITMTGGEPTLNVERFVNTMQIVRKYGFHCRTVSTTAICLEKKYKGKSLCQYMIENSFTHNINISRMHWDDSKNEEVFQGRNITNKQLERLRVFFKLNNAELRLSCNLLKGYIDNFEKMLNFLDYYEEDTIMFREVVGGIIKLSDIVNFDNRFTYIETLRGIYYNVDVYKYKDYLVKYYTTNDNIDKNIISSLSLRNGILSKDFKTEIMAYD